MKYISGCKAKFTEAEPARFKVPSRVASIPRTSRILRDDGSGGGYPDRDNSMSFGYSISFDRRGKTGAGEALVEDGKVFADVDGWEVFGDCFVE
jgi:hypothetical protein